MKNIYVDELKLNTTVNEERINGYETINIVKPICTVAVKINHTQQVGWKEITYGTTVEVEPPKELQDELLSVYHKIEDWVKESLK